MLAMSIEADKERGVEHHGVGEIDQVTLRYTNISMGNSPNLTIYLLLKMVVFHCYVRLPDASFSMTACWSCKFQEVVSF